MRSSSILNYLVACATLIALSACADSVLNSIDDVEEAGLSYYLPKTLVTIEITPIGRQQNDTVVELDVSQSEAAGSTGAVRVPAMIDGRRVSVLVNKDGKLVEDYITSLQLKQVDTEQIADTSQNYTLQYQPSILSKDKVCIGVSKKSLLGFVETSAKDETGNIVVALGKLAGRLAGPGAFAAQGAPRLLIQRKITLEIDPLDPLDRRAVEQAIGANFPQFRGRFEFKTEDGDRFRGDGYNEPCPINSVCYRTLVPVRMALVDKRTKQYSLAYTRVANRAVVNKIDVTRAFLVEKITMLGFDEGILTSVKVRKPSEGLALAQLPLTVYDAVVTSALAAPGTFLDKISPGMPVSDFNAIVAAYQTNLNQVNSIRTDLQTLRDNDFTPEDTGQNAPFTLKCNTTG